jgi:hypothetical protein
VQIALELDGKSWKVNRAGNAQKGSEEKHDARSSREIDSMNAVSHMLSDASNRVENETGSSLL